jgi:hypothetical protein
MAKRVEINQTFKAEIQADFIFSERTFCPRHFKE